MTFTQSQYTLWTGQTDTHEATDWAKIVKVAEIRLASFLCLPNGLPTDPDSAEDYLPTDLQELFANFIANVLATQGAQEEVESKHVRNFTINFRSTAASDAFAKIASKYEDIIELYSNCGLGFSVEKWAFYPCDYHGGCSCD